jgi:hypothetical protein
MNKIDKQFYIALKYLASHQTPEILDSLLDKRKKEDFRRYVSKAMDKTLQSQGYISFQPPANNVVTMKGLQYLRELEEIRRKELTFNTKLKNKQTVVVNKPYLRE